MGDGLGRQNSMNDQLPFTGWECPACGWLVRDSGDQVREHVCTISSEFIEVPGDPVRVFLNRWHWRGDRAVVERELRELIASLSLPSGERVESD